MNLDMFDRRRAERFAQLLDETSGGPRHHAKGQVDSQLTDLVGLGRTLSSVHATADVDPEFRTGLRAMLVATAERDGIGATRDETAPGTHPVRPPRLHGMLGRGGGRRIRARGAIVLGVAAGALAVSGISAASDDAVPGDVFYGVKRSTERAQLAMAGSDLTRGQLAFDFARTRLAEATALDGDDGAFRGVLADMDNDTRKGVRLLATSAVARTDATPLAAIDTFVTAQRHLLVPVLDRLITANRDRAQDSLTLLDEITRRAEALRGSIECDPDGATGSSGVDSLGPKPHPCWIGSDSSAPDGTRPGRGQHGARAGSANDEPAPMKDAPTHSPSPSADPTGGASVPDRKPADRTATPTDRATATPTAAPKPPAGAGKSTDGPGAPRPGAPGAGKPDPSASADGPPDVPGDRSDPDRAGGAGDAAGRPPAPAPAPAPGGLLDGVLGIVD